jgi:hypothetical protein
LLRRSTSAGIEQIEGTAASGGRAERMSGETLMADPQRRKHGGLVLILGGVVLVAYCVGNSSVTPPATTTSAPAPIVSPAWREANIKEFRAQLDLFHPHDQFSTTAVDLQDGVENLIRSGVSRDEAFRSILIVVQNPKINPASAYELAELGRRIAAAKRGEITR